MPSRARALTGWVGVCGDRGGGARPCALPRPRSCPRGDEMVLSALGSGGGFGCGFGFGGGSGGAPASGWVGVCGGGGAGDDCRGVGFEDVEGFFAQMDSDSDFVGRWLR